MPAVNILKFGVSSPSDVTPVDELRKAGYDPSQVIGLIGKSEGNGCVNDFSRVLSAMVWEPLLPKDAVTVFSGGTEGVLSPHVTFLVREHEGRNTGMLAAAGRTRKLEPHEVGTAEQAREVSRTVSALIDELESSVNAVHLVIVKGPLLTDAKIQAIRDAGATPPTSDVHQSLGMSRYASAVGVAVALGEVVPDELEGAIKTGAAWSAAASCTSGAELDDCHVLVLASAPEPGRLRAASTFMEDAIDGRAVVEALGEVNREGGHVLQVFAKAEADPRGEIRGKRHTMNTDSDIQSTRHARAAVGGLIAGLVGDTEIYCAAGLAGDMRDLCALRSFLEPYFERFYDEEGAPRQGPDGEYEYHYARELRVALAEHFWHLAASFHALDQANNRQFHLAGTKKSKKVRDSMSFR